MSVDAPLDRLVRSIPWSPEQPTIAEPLMLREWLVTNGLGGYATGTIAGAPTRRYHGLLIAAMPAPLGRMMLFNHLSELVRLPGGTTARFGGEELTDTLPQVNAVSHLAEFRLEAGLPVWVYHVDGFTIEKRILMPHRLNTVHINYRVTAGDGTLRLKLRPAVHFRHHDGSLTMPEGEVYTFSAVNDRCELNAGPDLPTLRLLLHGQNRAFTIEGKKLVRVLYRLEQSRGYDAAGELYTPGYFRVDLSRAEPVTLTASSEPWDSVHALPPDQVVQAERDRRVRLLQMAGDIAADPFAAELVLAADQFIIHPAARVQEAARHRAAGDESRSIIAGYHWFTDWGRDTMISLEGLTLVTGRHAEAGSILRTFADHVRDGLIPNFFPDDKTEGVYHTADATMWFFHAIDRYERLSGDRATRQRLLPTLLDIMDHHERGTRFGIGVDPKDGLLRQGQEGYQLTWMDAKVGDWVVTPRRGKAVEINALWYNALCLMRDWLDEERGPLAAKPFADRAERVRRSFNARFPIPERDYLYDVIDGPGGDDPACRPNQLLALSLPHPVLERPYWEPVLRTVERQLLTPVGLRSLSPEHPDYKARYDGDLRARDAAYHEGTVWAWLIGPFVDAWLRVYPDDKVGARRVLEGFPEHHSEACIGSISEVFDATEPFTPRGCIAQAWSIAEVLRSWAKLTEDATERPAVAASAAG